MELTGNTYPQVWPTDADNNHRRAKLFYLGGSKGWRVTFSDGRGDVNNTVIDYKKSDMGSDYYDQTNTAREAFKTAFDWVDGGNKKEEALTFMGSWPVFLPKEVHAKNPVCLCQYLGEYA